jgi:hypothetical protein
MTCVPIGKLLASSRRPSGSEGVVPSAGAEGGIAPPKRTRPPSDLAGNEGASPAPPRRRRTLRDGREGRPGNRPGKAPGGPSRDLPEAPRPKSLRAASRPRTSRSAPDVNPRRGPPFPRVRRKGATGGRASPTEGCVRRLRRRSGTFSS